MACQTPKFELHIQKVVLTRNIIIQIYKFTLVFSWKKILNLDPDPNMIIWDPSGSGSALQISFVRYLGQFLWTTNHIAGGFYRKYFQPDTKKHIR